VVQITGIGQKSDIPKVRRIGHYNESSDRLTKILVVDAIVQTAFKTGKEDQ
jgi:hypothetical protein